MILALPYDQHVVLQILVQHKPASAVAAAADTQPFSLPERIIGKPDMPAHRFARLRFAYRRASTADRLCRNSRKLRSPMKQIPVESFFSLTDKPFLRAIARTCAFVIAADGKDGICAAVPP